MVAGAMDKGSGESKGKGKERERANSRTVERLPCSHKMRGTAATRQGFFAEYRQGVGMEKQHSTQVTGLRQTGGGT